MNKILTIFIIVGVIITGFFVFSQAKQGTKMTVVSHDDMISSSYGFSFSLPEGWKFMESSSLLYDYQYHVGIEGAEISIEEFARMWDKTASRGLIFSTRDRDFTFQSEELAQKDTLDTMNDLDRVAFTILDSEEWGFSKNELFDSQDVNFRGVETQVSFFVSQENGDITVWLDLPLRNGEYYLIVSKIFPKESNYMKWFEEFLVGLELK